MWCSSFAKAAAHHPERQVRAIDFVLLFFQALGDVNSVTPKWQTSPPSTAQLPKGCKQQGLVSGGRRQRKSGAMYY